MHLPIPVTGICGIFAACGAAFDPIATAGVGAGAGAGAVAGAGAGAAGSGFTWTTNEGAMLKQSVT